MNINAFPVDPPVIQAQGPIPFGSESVSFGAGLAPGSIILPDPGINHEKKKKSNSSSLLLIAIVILAITWLIHTISTFIPYWATYSGIENSRAGLWSAANFNYTSIQNFYFPNNDEFANITDSITFTGSNTKGYLVTIQYMMVFNFCAILLLLAFLTFEFITTLKSPDGSGRFLFQATNSYETGMKFGIVIVLLFIFTSFEYASWITFVSARRDTNWMLHASFGLTVATSVFLTVVLVIFILELTKRPDKPRRGWEHWYGQYIQWAAFTFFAAVFLLLTVVVCPEWAYVKIGSVNFYSEIGLFKQCGATFIYKKDSTSFCTLSQTTSNQNWVNVSQAFMLMALISSIGILAAAIVFRKEFRHNESGYYPDRFKQPTFSFVLAGLIGFFCFSFSLIAVSVFGAEVFSVPFTANWAYILAVFAMFLFLVTVILLVLDALHSKKQATKTDSSGMNRLLFPEPLNQRVLQMEPSAAAQLNVSVNNMIQSPYLPNQMYPQINYNNAPMYPQQMPMHSLNNFGDMNMPFPYPNSPVQPTPILPPMFDRNLIDLEQDLMNQAQQHMIQQASLGYNHDRLLERFHRLTIPQTATYIPLSSNSLPGRNYDSYLASIDQSYSPDMSLALISRNRLGSSNMDLDALGVNSNTISEPVVDELNSFDSVYDMESQQNFSQSDDFHKEPEYILHLPSLEDDVD